MKVSKMSTRAVILFVLSSLSVSFAVQVLDCSPGSLSFKVGSLNLIDEHPTLYFLYNRNSLSVLEKNGQYANVSLPRVEIRSRFSSDVRNTVTSINPNVETIANVFGEAKLSTNSSGRRELQNCNLSMTAVSSKKSPKIPDSFITKLLDITQNCISARLCKLLGEIRSVDIVKEKVTPKPNIKAENTIDLLLKHVAEDFRGKNNGRIAIPDVRSIFKAKQGTFVGLSNLQRYKQFDVRKRILNSYANSYLFTFGIPQGHIEYLKYGFAGGQLCANIYDLTFTAEIIIDHYNQRYCRPGLTNVTLNSVRKTESYFCGRYSSITNMVFGWFANAFNSDIVKDIARQIDTELSTVLYESYSCQSFE